MLRLPSKRKQLATIERYVKVGQDEGAKVAVGGKRPATSGLPDGNYFEPTLLTGVTRGMRVALIAQDGFSKLLAAGLSFGLALQTFIIVGGVLRLVPLTGITLPFVSYGGTSIVANFAMVALLLLVSNRAVVTSR